MKDRLVAERNLMREHPVPAGSRDSKDTIQMKRNILATPRFYLWTLLVLIPFHATVMAYSNSIQGNVWVAILLKQSEKAASLMASGNKLMYIGYGLFVLEILLLLAAAARLPKLRTEAAS